MRMKKGKKWKKIEAFCIMLIVTLLLIFVRILYQPGTESERGELYTFSNGWYQLKDGKKTELKLPCFVTADKDGQIILYNDMLSEADKGKILSIRGIQDQLEVCIGDRLLYQYKDNRFEKNRQMKAMLDQQFLMLMWLMQKNFIFHYHHSSFSSNLQPSSNRPTNRNLPFNRRLIKHKNYLTV